METDRKALADRFVGLLAEWANANEDWKDAYDWADEPEMHAAALEKERIQGEIIAAATALREEGEPVAWAMHVDNNPVSRECGLPVWPEQTSHFRIPLYTIEEPSE